ncbi:MAG TPA: DUF1616 domain-containing protein [Dehalococcoidia bacterium]|nr:DUF1616 domain-containing protein [Dehalococcoidia bacterium]
MRIRLQNELLFLNLLTILLIAIVIFIPSNVLRIIVGLPFLLFFPGYTLIAALFPRRDALDSIERVALSFGLSIAVVPLIGLVLNYTPWGITLYPVLISIATFILTTSMVAWYRRRRLPEVERFTVSLNLSLALWGGQRSLDRILSIILIVAILGAVGTLGYVIATPKVGEKFTEFYVLGLEGKVIDYPSELKIGEEGKVIVGIINREHETVSYRVEVRIDGVGNNEVGNNEVGPLVLGHDEKWEEAVSFTPDRAGDSQKMEFLLYKNGGSEPYLKPLHLWVNVKE